MANGGERVLWGGGTGRTLRAHWMLHELGLDYEARLIGSRTGETQAASFSALNPGRKIPVLEDGPLVLCESAAIVTYLAEAYGAERALIPTAGTPERAHYYRWCFWAMTELDAHTLYVIRRHRDLAELYGEAPAAVRAAEQGFETQVAVAARALERGGPHLLGHAFTGADIVLTTCLDWAALYGFSLEPSLERYREQNAARPAYRKAVELNFSRALPLRPGT